MKQARIEVFGESADKKGWDYRHAILVKEISVNSFSTSSNKYPAIYFLDCDDTLGVKEISATSMYLIAPANPQTQVDVISSSDNELVDVAAVEITLSGVRVLVRKDSGHKCQSLKRILLLDKASPKTAVLEA